MEHEKITQEWTNILSEDRTTFLSASSVEFAGRSRLIEDVSSGSFLSWGVGIGGTTEAPVGDLGLA